MNETWDGKERRETWKISDKKCIVVIRRFQKIYPLIDGAAYGMEMVERRNLKDRRKIK